WRRIAEEAEGKGMSLESTGTFESIGVSVDALAQDWELALEWAAEVLLDPVFPADRCAWTARQAAAELESLADQPEVKTAWSFQSAAEGPAPASPPPARRRQSPPRPPPRRLRPLPPGGAGARRPRLGGRRGGRGRRGRPPRPPARRAAAGRRAVPRAADA